MEENAAIHPEGTAAKKQDNTTTKTISMRKIHANEIQAKIGHTGEKRMRATVKHLHCSIQGMLEVFE